MRKDLKKLYELLTPRKRKQAVGVIFVMLVAAGLQAASVGALYPFLNAVTDPQSIEAGWMLWVQDTFGLQSYNQFLAALGLGVLALLVLANAALSLSHWARVRFQWAVNHELSVRLLKSYLGRDYTYFLNHNTAEMNQNILDEATKVTQGLLNPVLSMFSNASIAIGMVTLLVIVDPLATLLVLGITGGGYGIAYLVIRKRMQRLGSAYSEANRKRFKSTAEAFGGIKDVKVLGREAYFLEEFEPASHTFARTNSARNVLSALPKYVIEALAMGSLLAVLVTLLITGQPVSLIVPIMGTFVFAGYRMMPAFRDILKTSASFRFTEEIFDSIETALDAPRSKEIGADRNVDPLPFEDRVELNEVVYRYPGTRQAALKNVSVSVPKDSAVAFVGKTGAGKTTIIDMLLGLLWPTEGGLTVDGVPVTKDNVHRWRANLGYVPQDIYLADTTVRRNIAYGIPEKEIHEEALVQAAKTAHIHEFVVNELPEGYDTTIGEEGVRLSGGQRQRIGIARALYHDPPVLVLDEATSDIDGETEANITQAIQELQGVKTLVVVAHRLKTIQHCDVVYVVHKGEVVGEGDYESLHATNERFQRLTGEAVVEADPSGGTQG